MSSRPVILLCAWGTIRPREVDPIYDTVPMYLPIGTTPESSLRGRDQPS